MTTSQPDRNPGECMYIGEPPVQACFGHTAPWADLKQRLILLFFQTVSCLEVELARFDWLPHFVLSKA